MTQTNAMLCKVPGCGHSERHWLADHLLEAHGLTTQAYLTAHPGAPTASKKILGQMDKKLKKARRAHPPAPSDLFVTMARMTFPVHAGVPESVCLPMPPNYRLPTKGALGKDVILALAGLKMGRSLFIHGLPGCGKDALFHYYSAATRTPGILRQVVPGTDIESWFFTRSFNEEGTFWEEGDLLKALRDGYVCEDGTRVPYLVVFSDLDRADRSQGEYMRLITDSIAARIMGPGGQVYNVLPGTQLVATANTAGSGDSRGRMISSNPIDGSLMDRWDRAYHFHQMDWADELPIVEAKRPYLLQRAPGIFKAMGAITPKLRSAVENQDIYGEFSHRAVCQILEAAEDLLRCNGSNKVPKNLLREAVRCWVDKLGDEDTRIAAMRIMDPHLKGGALNAGQSPVKPGSLNDDF